MLRKFFLLLVVGLLLISIQVEGVAPDCNAAEFADVGTQDYFKLECGAVDSKTGQQPDGLCPEDYGDWGPCNVNAVTGGKCNVPDVDCGQVIPDVMFVEFPSTIEQNTAFTLNVRVNKCYFPADGTGNDVMLVRNFGGVAAPDLRLVGITHITGPMTVNFADPANPDLKSPGGGGVPYQFLTYCADKPNYAVAAEGITTPVVMITGPAQGCTVVGNQNVQADASSTLGIDRIEFGVEVEISPGVYTPVTPSTCLTCSGTGCNVFTTNTHAGQPSVVGSTGVFDSAPCDNVGVRLNVNAYDVQQNFGNAAVTCTIANANPGCPGCNFASQFLNLVVARVKIWT